jgi:hypothetical protein
LPADPTTGQFTYEPDTQQTVFAADKILDGKEEIIEKNQAENAFLVYNPYTFQVKYIMKSYKMIL